jgi:hypothetical protein
VERKKINSNSLMHLMQRVDAEIVSAHLKSKLWKMETRRIHLMTLSLVCTQYLSQIYFTANSK